MTINSYKQNTIGETTSHIDFTITSNSALGRNLLLVIAYDNSGGSGEDTWKSPVFDDRGNTWIEVNNSTISPTSSPSDGLCLRFFRTTQDVAALQVGDTISIDFNADVNKHIEILFEIVASNTVSYDSSDMVPTETIYSTITTGALVSNSVVFGVSCGAFNGDRFYDTDTTNGSWVDIINDGTDGLEIVSQYKLITGVGAQTYNVDFTDDGSDSNIPTIIGYVVFTEEVIFSSSVLFILNTTMS